MTLILLLAAAAGAAPPPPDDTIVVTAPTEPVQASVNAPAKAEEPAYPWDGLPMIADLLRLTPGLSVSVSGPRGAQTQIRMRGAEANHTLLFVDGIRFNDPAAGNEARFELLTNDGIDSIDIRRGPDSAFFGSEAIGGVVEVETNGAHDGLGIDALAEYGSLDSARGSLRASGRTGKLELGGTAAWQASDGIDSFGPAGEQDGFDNRSAGFKALARLTPDIRIGAVGHWIEATSEYDGLDPVTFRRADTLDETRNRIAAGRLWGEADIGDWSGKLESSLLDSANRNRLDAAPLNSTFGRRLTAGAQLSRWMGGHSLTLALDYQAEHFQARDQVFFGGTDQDRERDVFAATGAWHAKWSGALTTDLVIRHDRFSAFADATTVRASADVRPARNWRLIASYAEGIAQPTFYDLYGFFPGSFSGNPTLGPERSKGWDVWVKWREKRRLSLGLSLFTARLEDEIVDVFDPATFRSTAANARGTSRRKGIEVDGEWRLGKAVNLSFNYTLLDAEERQVAGGLKLHEVRRPRHSFNLAGSGRAGPFTWGATLAYVGERGDTDFDVFPARAVTLGDYVLASARVAWRISPALEAYARAENAFDARYQDVVGYRTPGRTVYAGLRLRFRD
ncbi:MAG: vitamin transporter [Sphingomonadales bacterium]|nr:vitamin transporter [Sphingomonadales bacterium]